MQFWYHYTDITDIVRAYRVLWLSTSAHMKGKKNLGVFLRKKGAALVTLAQVSMSNEKSGKQKRQLPMQVYELQDLDRVKCISMWNHPRRKELTCFVLLYAPTSGIMRFAGADRIKGEPLFCLWINLVLKSMNFDQGTRDDSDVGNA
jgi:hypothetical protein